MIALKTMRLGDLGEFRNGVNFGKGLMGRGLGLINVKDLFVDSPKVNFDSLDRVDLEKKNGIEKYFVEDGDLFFVRSSVKRDGIGFVAYAPTASTRVVHCGFVIRFRPNPDRIDSRFLTYLLRSPVCRERIKNLSGGAAITNISQRSLSEVLLDVPLLPVQRRVAGILSAYDDLIENCQRRIAILEEMARSLYREWFVHFRFPGHEECEFVKTPHGSLPSEWEHHPISNLSEFINGFAFKRAHWGEVGIPIIKIKELKNGVSKDTPRNTGETIKDKYLVQDGDVLFSWSAHLDAYLWKEGSGLLNQHLFNCIPKGDLPKSFLYHSLLWAMPRFRALSIGATMQHIKRSALDEVHAVVPDQESLVQFDNLVGPIHDLQIVLNHKINALRRSRDLLLPRLMSGQINLDEA